MSSIVSHLHAVRAELTGPDGPFAVERIDVNGVLVPAYRDAAPTLAHLWQGVARHGDRDYLVYEDERFTYAEADRQVRLVAAWLQAQGVQPGDRVVVAMRNLPEWVLAYWATVGVGAVVVGLNAWWTSGELAFGIRDCGARVAVLDAERHERLVDELPGLGLDAVLVARTDGAVAPGVTAWSEVAAADAGAAPELGPITASADDPVCLFYTSGTTGDPKGAVITHRSAANNLLNMAYWNTAVSLTRRRAAEAHGAAGNPAATSADGTGDSGGGGGFVFLLPVPLFHVTGCNCVMHPVTATGGTLVLMHRWNPERALELIERERVTNLTGVPTMARELLASPDFERRDTTSLRTLAGGGAAVQPDLVGKIDQKLQKGRPGTGYGLTETSGVIALNSADLYVEKPDSVGPAMPTFDTRVVDEAGEELPAGQVGELWVRGAPVVAGYFGRPEATAAAIVDGWFRTGDIARVDPDGFITIVDRVKDVVIRGGENIYCGQVEAAIHDLDAVAECAVFGVPDDRLGEVVGVAVVPHDGRAVSADEVAGAVTARMAAYAAPGYVWLLDDPLPRNANGKFLKRDLKATLDPADAVRPGSEPV